jgi:PAS domain S-box-containing protein
LGVISKAGAIFFHWDAYFGLTFLSANARDLLGYSLDELIGDPDLARRVVAPEFIDELEKMASDFFVVGDEAVRVEIPLITRTGERVRIQTRVVPEVDAAGRVMGFLGLALNAAEEVQGRAHSYWRPSRKGDLPQADKS